MNRGQPGAVGARAGSRCRRGARSYQREV